MLTRTTWELGFPPGSGRSIFASHTTSRFSFSLSSGRVCWEDTNNRTLYFRHLRVPACGEWNEVTATWHFSEAKHFSPGKKYGQALEFPRNSSLFLPFLPAGVISFVTKITCLFIKCLYQLLKTSGTGSKPGCVAKSKRQDQARS